MQRVFEERTLSRGEVLFRASDPVATVFLIASGEVELFVDAAQLAPRDGGGLEHPVWVLTAEAAAHPRSSADSQASMRSDFSSAAMLDSLDDTGAQLAGYVGNCRMHSPSD